MLDRVLDRGEEGPQAWAGVRGGWGVEISVQRVSGIEARAGGGREEDRE